ncbi:MAG TPA: hypothetical protein VMN39_05860 [Longimicrobiaceae bacterium]|nr:hypothetical protein [Longimicrobiaceae bacterium]
MGGEGHRTRELQDRALAIEAATTVTVDGEELPYRRLPIEIRKEPDRGRRAALEEARRGVVAERLNPIHADAIGEFHAVADELLGLTYAAYCAQLARLDFDDLESRTEAFLAETVDAHRDLLAWYAKRALGSVPDDLANHDLYRILYGEEYRELFPQSDMVPRIRRVVGRMGLDPLAGGRIDLDVEERPKKSPRAFCAAIRVPDEVKLVLQPHGGLDDYVTFLHELGHALHFAHVDAGLPVESRRLGDNAVTESYAFTFDHLMLLPEFLRDVVELESPADYLRFAGLREMVFVRRYCAKFRYERSLHREGPAPARAEEYAERLEAATGARTPPDYWLDDVDPHFYCVRYLRAWMFAGALHGALRDRFDSDWFRNPRTGPFLVDLWALGQSRPPEALARERLGLDELDFEPLLGMIHECID